MTEKHRYSASERLYGPNTRGCYTLWHKNQLQIRLRKMNCGQNTGEPKNTISEGYCNGNFEERGLTILYRVYWINLLRRLRGNMSAKVYTEAIPGPKLEIGVPAIQKVRRKMRQYWTSKVRWHCAIQKECVSFSHDHFFLPNLILNLLINILEYNMIFYTYFWNIFVYHIDWYMFYILEIFSVR